MLILLVFALGASLGSFIGVLIYRTTNPKEGSPFVGRSFCDNCKRQLTWYENIPVVSYIALRGQCKTCHKPISKSYLLVEVVTGLLFVWWMTLGFAFFKLTQAPLLYLQPTFWLVIGLMLIIIFFADVLHGIIPDFATATIGLVTLLYRAYLVWQGVMRGEDLASALMSGIAAGGFFLALFLATRGRGLGFGDVKFSLVMGLLLGFPKAIVGFFLSFLFGGVVGVGLLALGRKKVGQTVPFGPFLVSGLVTALVWGDAIWQWYMSMLR